LKKNIEEFLWRNSQENAKFAVIDLNSRDLVWALERDSERKEELYVIKGIFLRKALDFLMKLYEEKGLEIGE